MSDSDFFNNKDTENQYFLFAQALKKHVKDLSDSNISVLKEKLEVFEELGQMKRDIVFLVDMPISNFFFISTNVKNRLGYSKEELIEMGFAKMIFKSLPASQIIYPLLSLGWFLKIERQQSSNFEQMCVCGMQLKSKLGRRIHFLAQVDVVARTPAGFPALAICTLKEITHLLKSNLYWVRFVNSAGKPLGFFKSSRPLKQFSDILTTREKEILAILPASSEQIAKHFKIQVSTVVKHRKNMLLKTGAKDTTALIQLCKMSNIA